MGSATLRQSPPHLLQRQSTTAATTAAGERVQQTIEIIIYSIDA